MVGFCGPLARITRAAVELDLLVSRAEVAGFVVSRARGGATVPASSIRSTVSPGPEMVCRPNLEAASDYINGVAHGRVPVANRVNIVGGVSLAVLDLQESSGSTINNMQLYTAYIMLMQRSFASIGRHNDDIGMSIGLEYSVALMVDVLGRLAGEDQHLNMRCMEALLPLLGSISITRVGYASVAHLGRGLSALLEANAPLELKDELRRVASPIVPEAVA